MSASLLLVEAEVTRLHAGARDVLADGLHGGDLALLRLTMSAARSFQELVIRP